MNKNRVLLFSLLIVILLWVYLFYKSEIQHKEKVYMLNEEISHLENQVRDYEIENYDLRDTVWNLNNEMEKRLGEDRADLVIE